MSGGPLLEIPGIEASLAETLAKIEIPPRPVVLDKVMAEMQADEPDFRRLSALILADVGMSASLIKTANAPIFGYRSKAATVRDALTMLGLINVLRTLAGIALQKIAPETPAMHGFWETSGRVAHLGGWLVKQVGVRDAIRSEDAYTYALFHDCGIPLLLKALPGYEATYELARGESARPITAIETERHALNHAMVGCALAHSWYLPQVHVQAILHHHDLDLLTSPDGKIPPGSRRLIALVHLAEMLEHGAGGVAYHEWSRMGEACLAILGLTPARLDELQPGAIEILKGIE